MPANYYPFGASASNDNYGGANASSAANQAQRVPQAFPTQPANSLLDKTRRRPLRLELSDEQKAEIREAFEIFDMDKDGALDFHEFKVLPHSSWT
jgi:hypothetical protein